MTQVLLVGLGGFIGSVSRYLLTTHIHIPTSAINLLGSFFIGCLLGLNQSKLGDSWEHFLIPGLLGGFTTYSAFSGETLLMIKNQMYVQASSYIALTLIGGLGLAFLGYKLSHLYS